MIGVYVFTSAYQTLKSIEANTSGSFEILMPETGILLRLIEWSSFGPPILSTCSNGNGPSSYKLTLDNSNTDKSKYHLYFFILMDVPLYVY